MKNFDSCDAQERGGILLRELTPGPPLWNHPKTVALAFPFGAKLLRCGSIAKRVLAKAPS